MAEWIKPGININFVGRRKKFWLLSSLAILVSIGALAFNYFARGAALNYGTDFKGGTQLQIEFAAATRPAQVRDTLASAGYRGAEVVELEDAARPHLLFMVRLTEVSSFSEEAQRKAKAALKQAFGDKVARFEYKSGGDRVRLYFAKGFELAPEPVSAKAEPTSQPASQPSSQPTAASSQPTAAATEASKTEPAAVDEADLKRLQEIFTKAGIAVANVLRVGRAEDNRYEVVLGGLGEDVREAFETRLGKGSIKDIPQVESVGAKMGQQLRDDGIKSVIYALLLMLVYIAFRFDFRYAPGAVVALAHDVTITVGLFAITWAEFSLPVVAALLTIAGYSINDTIVVFDRIRENVVRLRDRKFALVVNASLNETLSRTLLTSVTTLFTCIAVWVVGTGVLKAFAFALTAGVLIGTYSSLFIASPIVVVLNQRFAAKAKR